MRGFKFIFVWSKHKINCFLIQEKYFQTANAADTLPLNVHVFKGPSVWTLYIRRHWPLMTRRFHDIISSLLSAKWISESKSAPQVTLEGSRTRKKSAKVVDLIWPQLTSVDLRKTGWHMECMSTTWYYMSKFISLANTTMFASYVPRNAFSPWHDPSYDVISQMLGGSGSWNVQGDVKKMCRKL